MIYSLVKRDFSNLRKLILSNTPMYENEYEQAVEKLTSLRSSKDFRVGFSLSTFRNILYECKDTAFKLDMLDRVEAVVLAEIEGDELTFCEMSVSTNMYYFFEQDTFDTSDDWSFWPTPLGNTQLCEQLLLPYLKEEAFCDINSKREKLGYLALEALLKEKSITAYHFLKSLLTSNQVIKLKPPSHNYWEFHLKSFFEAIGGVRLFRNIMFYVGNSWEDLCYEILQQKYNNLMRHPRLPNNSIPDIALGDVQTDKIGNIEFIDLIIECKKSVYFYVLTNDPIKNYAPYCNHLEFWVLEKANNPYFTYPHGGRIEYRFACDFLNSPKVPEAYKVQMRQLLDISKSVIDIREYNTPIEICHAIDKYLEIPSEILNKFQRTKKKIFEDRTPKIVVRQYQLDGTFIKQFDSVKQASSEIKVGTDAIINVTRGRRNSAGGFLWRRCKADEPINNIIPISTTLNTTGKVIYQVDGNGEIVAIFESTGKAEKATGINRRSISDALKGIQRSAGGFTWVLSDKV